MDNKTSVRLKEIRNQTGLTQRQFSKEIEVNPSYYSDLENGRRTITGKFVDKLVLKYGISRDWLYTGKGENKLLISNHKIHQKNTPLEHPFPEDYWDDDTTYFRISAEKRLLLDILNNHHEIKDLYNNLQTLQSFEFLIGNLNYYYFNSISKQFHNSKRYLKKGEGGQYFDYENYKKDFLSELSKAQKYDSTLTKIAEAIKQFYKDFEQFDTQKILDGLNEKNI